jgi:hypothetical protein
MEGVTRYVFPVQSSPPRVSECVNVYEEVLLELSVREVNRRIKRGD